MTPPRLEIDLKKIKHNACKLVERLSSRGISVTGVTKATLGMPEIATTLLEAGVSGLGDSRIENIEAMRRAGINSPMTLIRSPMLSQVARVVSGADVSFNTEIDVMRQLSLAAQDIGRTHGVVLMVELGDRREGIMPGDLEHVVRKTLRFPNIEIKGIGTNLACRSGVVPDKTNMAELSALSYSIELLFQIRLSVISGGNSSNLTWALEGSEAGRVNNLRLGEAILLGCEPLYRQPIEGLHNDAFTLVAEVIESKNKPTKPCGDIAQNAFGEASVSLDHGPIQQALFALGRQDIDPSGLLPPPGIEILGASSDHLIVDTCGVRLPVGAEIKFGLNYSALLRAMTSPFVAKVTTVTGRDRLRSRRVVDTLPQTGSLTAARQSEATTNPAQRGPNNYRAPRLSALSS